MKLKRSTYRHIESEIFDYNNTLKAIQEMRLEILAGERQDEKPRVSGGGYVCSVVEHRATRLADSILLREMQRITGAIRDTYSRARDECRQVLYVKYGILIEWKPPDVLLRQMEGKNRADLSSRAMSIILSVDESTFHRYRSGFVYAVAEKLGWW